MQIDLLSLLDALVAPMPQLDHFKATHLTSLFRSKISKSQATGKDGVRIARFEELLPRECLLIEKKIGEGTYKFTTFKERLILRGADRAPRQISIPTVRDRLTLRAICQILHSHKSETIGKTPHALVRTVAAAIRDGDQSSKSFVRVDVRNFFPSISHLILNRELKHFGFVEDVRELCMKAISTPTGTATAPNERGIPQGLSVSGALAGLFMLRFDALREKEVSQYFRYVDDILLICDTKDAENEIKNIGKKLSSRGLIIHKAGVVGKTEISPVVEGVDFLGYRICIDLISVRSSSYKRMFKNLLKVITDYRYRRNFDKLVFRLNLKITGCVVDSRRRGWMMFFSHTENMQQLAHLDAFVSRQLAKLGLSAIQREKIKRFVKTWHEIRYRMTETSYIPNFDLYGHPEKAEAVAALSGKTLAEVLAMDVEIVETLFSRLISREVHDLEQDVGNPS
ncbi:MAG: RNA-directed DNA polymerase [Minicystis sp.]